MKQQILNYSLEELQKILEQNNFPKFRAKQIWQWIYKKGCDDFNKMHNLPKDLVVFLNDHYVVCGVSTAQEQKSQDGTIKWLLSLHDGKKIEAVFIPEDTRGTLCISSQVGCTLNCHFCHTGTQRLEKNLETSEIIGQIFLAKKLLNDFAEQKIISNIVFMGMGEPLLNYDNVKQACKMLIEENHFNFSWRKITISTSGIIPNIKKMKEEIKTGLAISFHAPSDEIRTKIMPINKKYNIKELLEICKEYAMHTKQIITLEYIMLDQINDQIHHAEELVKLVKDMPVKFNLIPFNPWPGCEFARSSNNRIHKFSEILQKNNIEAPIRKTRGEDILAACGQLKNLSL